jgi:small redox-active disulfide protein 2
MLIQILGTGCPKCAKTYEHATRAVEECGIEAEIEKVERIDEIMAFGILVTPALAIDGEVRVAGRVPGVEEIKTLLRSAGSPSR